MSPTCLEVYCPVHDSVSSLLDSVQTLKFLDVATALKSRKIWWELELRFGGRRDWGILHVNPILIVVLNSGRSRVSVARLRPPLILFFIIIVKLGAPRVFI